MGVHRQVGCSVYPYDPQAGVVAGKVTEQEGGSDQVRIVPRDKNLLYVLQQGGCDWSGLIDEPIPMVGIPRVFPVERVDVELRAVNRKRPPPSS